MWTLSGMEIQRHPSRYANAAQWLRYSNVSHPGDVEELTQTEQGGGNTEGSGDRTEELLWRQAEAHAHSYTHERARTHDETNTVCESAHTRAYSSRISLLINAPTAHPYMHAFPNLDSLTEGAVRQYRL